MPINRHIWFLITPIFICSDSSRKNRKTQSVFFLVSEHSLFGIHDVTWLLRHGQRMIGSGLLVTIPFALGRPPKLVVEMAKRSTEWETVMEEYEA